MKHLDEEIEKELARLKPVAPSDALQAKIESALEETQPKDGLSFPRFWPMIALATAACLIFVFAISITRTSKEANSNIKETPAESFQPVASNSFEPPKAEQRLLEAIDDGIVFTEGREPVRKLRYKFVDTLTVVDKNDGSVFTMEIPREEILFVPITLL